MTKHVPKGANRPAHAARTARAAQRTPLPPKGATSGVERTSVKVAKKMVAETKASKEPPKQYAKAAEFAKAVEALNNGWTIKKAASGDRAEVTGSRGSESFHIAWVNNVYERWAGYTGYGANDKRVPNAKSMLVLCERSEAQASAAPAPRPAGAPRAPRSATAQPREPFTLPWDDDTPDEEVLEMVKGKHITWRNILAVDVDGKETEGALQEARVPKDEIEQVPIIDKKTKKQALDKDNKPRFKKEMRAPRHLKVQRNAKNERVISFASMSGPFRACNENNILSIR